jgi:hypothetical protein
VADTDTWSLLGFELRLDQWRRETHPPGYVHQLVDEWWPSLQHAPRRVGTAIRGKPGARFAWVPNCYLPDLGDGRRGVQCHYRITGRQVVCQFFVTARHESVEAHFDV